MNIYEYLGPLSEYTRENIFWMIPSAWSGIPIFASAISAAVFVYFYRRNKKFSEAAFLSRWFLLIPSIIYIGTYISHFGMIDEVAINLEHVHNLFHYGKFSMSPDHMVDGTVEFLFYLLHLPFAARQDVLVLGNILIGLLVGWLHILCLWLIQGKQRTVQTMLFLSAFAGFVPVIMTFASGFGNSLLSLGCLFAIYRYSIGKSRQFLVCSGLLPLIRPDGIGYSAAFFALYLVNEIFIERRRIESLNLFLALALPLASLSFYFCMMRYFYGHWIPTPVLFKSVKPHMLMTLDWAELKKNIGLFFFQIQIVLPAIILALGSLCALYKLVPFSKEAKRFAVLTAVFFPALAAVFISGNLLHLFPADYTELRYAAPFLVVLFLLSWEIIRNIEDSQRSNSRFETFSPALIFFMLFCIGLFQAPPALAERQAEGFFQRAYAAKAGFLTDQIVPEDFVIASGEMNTFGLAVERPILDLWGYSTREIAKSPFCSRSKLRTVPNFMLKKSPDIVWAWMFSHFAYNYRTAEKALYVNVKEGVFGNPALMSRAYDVFLIRDRLNPDDNIQIGYFVKKSSKNRFMEALKESGFTLNYERTAYESYLDEWDEKHKLKKRYFRC